MAGMGKKLCVLLIAALILVCTPAASAIAEGAAYTYTVRFYSGQQGTFADGREVITYTGLSYGSIVTFNPSGVVLKNDSKYYIKGIRESGRDNNTVAASSFVVTCDRDYVVAYGLRGDMVAYTVNYVDVSGAELAPSDVYYGNVGDKPVVAFLYIDGYQPQAYNLTKTLLADEAQNVFTFVYSPFVENEGNTTVTKTVVPETTRSVVEVIPGDTEMNRNSSEDTTSQNVVDADANVDTDTNQNDFVPEDIGQSNLIDPFEGIDLDEGIDLADPAVPLADMKFNIGPIEVDARMMLVLIVILIAVSVVGAASWWYWKPYRKKGSNEKKDAAQPV